MVPEGKHNSEQGEIDPEKLMHQLEIELMQKRTGWRRQSAPRQSHLQSGVSKNFHFPSAAEALATNFMSLLRTRRDGAELFALVREQRKVERYELEMREPTGESVYVVARFVGIFDEEGELIEL